MMTVTEQIEKNLVDPEKHGPILRALVAILEDGSEKALKGRISEWVREILEAQPDTEESEDL